MIEAAMLAGQDQGPLPPELIKAFRCRKWGALPEAGGLNDQPLTEMLAIESVLNVYEAFRMRSQASNAVEFSKRHPGIVEMCANIERMINE